MGDGNNQHVNATASDNTIFVKDYDGTLKVFSGGELKELDEFLRQTELAREKTAAVKPELHLDIPKFTDIAPIPQESHFREPTAMGAPHEKATLHFHGDDKDEIARELAKLSHAFEIQPQKKYSIIKIARKLAEKHGIKFSEEDFVAFTKALLSFFRQMRSSVETKNRLTDTKDLGGFAIPPAVADDIISVARFLKDKIEEKDGTVVEEIREEPPPAGHREPEGLGKPQPVTAPEPKPEPEEEAEKIQVRVMSQAAPPQSAPLQPVPPLKREPPSLPKRESPPPLPTRESQPPSKPEIKPIAEEPKMPRVMRPAPLYGKTPLVDIKSSRAPHVEMQLTGRVDELHRMDLATWRMLDADPRIRAGKILGKIQNLEQESFTRKSQGIDAWRASEVYQHYLKIGQTSLEQGKDVAKVIGAMRENGQESLTIEEFEAITDLNRMLRY